MDSVTDKIEREIQEFVFSRTGERVYLALGTEGQVAIRPVSPHGSTVLGIFWLKVLQHPNNYAVNNYPYRRLYKAAGKYVVSLCVDTVKITVCLVTGTFIISGMVSLDWFVMRFSDILKAYVQPVGIGSQRLKDPFDAEQKRLMKTVRKQMLRRYTEDWPDVVIDEDMNVLDARQILKQKEEEARQGDDADSVPVLPLLGEKPMDIYHLDNLLSPSSLRSHLEKLKQGIMADGATLYSVWTSLLDKWFSDPDTRVFMVTPAIDGLILERLCHIVLNHRLSACLQMLATPLQSKCGRLADVRRDVMVKLPPQDQVFVEYKVYNSMVYPKTEFQAKFIAGLRDNTVEVLLTSADARVKHFHDDHSSMVIYQKLTTNEFDSHLLAPIVATVD